MRTIGAAVLMQVPDAERNLEVRKQTNEPLSFLSSSFTGSSFNWSIVEKEDFVVVEAMTKLNHYTAAEDVSLCKDHANLVKIFEPYERYPGNGKHTANKMMH